jgi:hypothetical protein
VTAPFVYLERDSGGRRLLGVRLIGDGGHEEWAAPDAEDAPALAASWIRSRLADGSRVAALCLDPRGVLCSWLDTPGADPAVVRAAARQARAGAWGDWPASPSRDHPSAEAALDWRAASVQAVTSADTLNAAPAGRGLVVRGARGARPASRSAVVAAADLPVRLLIDELDRRGVVIDRVITLWHAMAAAWDTAAEADASDDPLVSRDTSDAAVILIEPAGRVQWVWSATGSVLAAGGFRLDAAALNGSAAARAAAAGRLGADWLAWSAQLGRSPGRVLCLAPEDLADAAGIGSLGEAIASSWPEASFDLFRIDDPVDATLRRLLDRTAGGRARRALPASATLGDLAARPGRGHRAMYRWGAAALVAAAAALVVLGVRLRASADRARTESAEVVAAQRELVAAALPAGTDLTYPTLAAQSELDRLRAASTPLASVQATLPVLAGVDQIAFVVSSFPDVRLERLTVEQTVVSVVVSGPDTASVELIPGALQAGTDLFDWKAGAISRRQDRYQTTTTGVWTEGGPR